MIPCGNNVSSFIKMQFVVKKSANTEKGSGAGQVKPSGVELNAQHLQKAKTIALNVSHLTATLDVSSVCHLICSLQFMLSKFFFFFFVLHQILDNITDFTHRKQR